MTEYIHLFNYISIAGIVGCTTLGVGIGSGKSSFAALQAMNIQPSAKQEITKATIIGLALIETAAILALIIIFLIFPWQVSSNEYQALAKVGIACAIGITGFMSGLVSAYPLSQACYALARQPFFSQKIINLMLITQSIIQTPLIFGFLVSLAIIGQLESINTLTQSLMVIASGLAIGVGSIGPIIGLAKFAQTACQSISINKKAYNQLIPFTFMSQAIIETPIIFALLISLIIIGSLHRTNITLLTAVQALAASLCIGIGTISPGLSSSKTASNACKQIALNPQHYRKISQISLFGQGLIDAAAVYALLISLFIVLLK